MSLAASNLLLKTFCHILGNWQCQCFFIKRRQCQIEIASSRLPTMAQMNYTGDMFPASPSGNLVLVDLKV